MRQRKSDGWNSASFKPDVSEWLKRESQEQELSISRKVTCDENVPMKSIDEHIQKDKTDIEAAKAAGDDAKVRHLEGELHSLEEYKEHNPNDKHDPTSLELYCDANPDADECRVYDD